MSALSHAARMTKAAWRRRSWLLQGLTPRKALNFLLASAHYGLKSSRMSSWPVSLKVDISPLCNLRCTWCVHANATSASDEELRGQTFDIRQMMTVAQFRGIVDEVSGKSTSISMYYLGDPLIHPDLDEMCAIACAGKLATHISSNFSFRLTDERIRSIVTSGLTHLTVCVDGMAQADYERTRVGGNLARVLDNLERLLACRRRLGRQYPEIEVQYIKFQHNQKDVEKAARLCERLGVDQFTSFWGSLNGPTDRSPGKYNVLAPKTAKRLPLCLLPVYSMVIKYNGDVIPCCTHRTAAQYHDSGDSRVLGNVFETSVREVWNSPEYRAIRRFVADPRRVLHEPALTETFCHGCPELFETDLDRLERKGDQYEWDDLYARDDRGRVASKASAAIGEVGRITEGSSATLLPILNLDQVRSGDGESPDNR